jgi:hypothetical protein
VNRPIAPDVRFRVDPADVPLEKAARRLHLTPEQFRDLLPKLLLRGFPAADPDTGMFDLEAIDRWRRDRHARELTSAPPDLKVLVPHPSSMADRFSAAKERQTERRRRDRGAT